MKTIEQVAFNRYLSDQSLPERKRLNPSNYIDLAYLGAIEAQRFILISEELPEHSMNIESKGNYKYTPQVIYKTKNNKVGITRREEFLDHGFRWRGSGSLQDGIISWRPIERK